MIPIPFLIQLFQNSTRSHLLCIDWTRKMMSNNGEDQSSSLLLFFHYWVRNGSISYAGECSERGWKEFVLLLFSLTPKHDFLGRGNCSSFRKQYGERICEERGREKDNEVICQGEYDKSDREDTWQRVRSSSLSLTIGYISILTILNNVSFQEVFQEARSSHGNRQNSNIHQCKFSCFSPILFLLFSSSRWAWKKWVFRHMLIVFLFSSHAWPLTSRGSTALVPRRREQSVPSQLSPPSVRLPGFCPQHSTQPLQRFRGITVSLPPINFYCSLPHGLHDVPLRCRSLQFHRSTDLLTGQPRLCWSKCLLLQPGTFLLP